MKAEDLFGTTDIWNFNGLNYKKDDKNIILNGYLGIIDVSIPLSLMS